MARLRRATTCGAAAFATVVAAESPAEAHLVGVEFGAFYAGALHFTLSVASVAAVIALGLLAAGQERRRARWMLLALPLGLIVGVLAHRVIGATLPAEPAVALGLVLLGLLGALALRVPTAVTAALAFAIGGVHGFANGLTVDDGAAVDWPLFASGVIVAGWVLGTLAIAGASSLAGVTSWIGLARQVLSSWIAAMGLAFFAISVTQ